MGEGAAWTRRASEPRKTEAKGCRSTDGELPCGRPRMDSGRLVFDPPIDSEIDQARSCASGPMPARGQVWLGAGRTRSNQPAIRALRRWLLAESGG